MCRYGQWYFNNKACFDQFLNLSQGKLTFDEYYDERLQVQCALDEDDEHYVTIFTFRLRPTKHTKKYERLQSYSESILGGNSC